MFYDQLFPSTINILGTEWKITVAKYEDDPYFKKYDANGYCSAPEHLICICDESTWPANKDESILFIINSMKCALRHEIVHAFFRESGLYDSSFKYDGSWANNEEMVDWFALQGPKIFKAWEEAHCLEVMSPEEWMKNELLKAATEWKVGENDGR